MDLGESVQSVCSERDVTATAGGSEVSDVRAEEVLRTQGHIRSALSLPAVTATDKVCYVCNIVLLQRYKFVLRHVHSESVLCDVVIRQMILTYMYGGINRSFLGHLQLSVIFYYGNRSLARIIQALLFI
jgi:hypothetical protein